MERIRPTKPIAPATGQVTRVHSVKATARASTAPVPLRRPSTAKSLDVRPNPQTGRARQSAPAWGTQIPEAFESLFSEEYRIKGYHGGRGGAKSHSVAEALLIRGRNKKLLIGCFREVQNSIKDSVHRLLKQKIVKLGFQNFYKVTENGIKGRNGTEFLFKGLRGEDNAEAIKSLEGIDIAWVEEAHTITQGSLDILEPTIRVEGSEIIFTWNPRFATDPIDKILRPTNDADLPPRTIVVEVNYEDNPWFPDVLREKMEWDRKRDPDKYQHIWRGGYKRNSESRVFKNWRVVEFDTPKTGVQFYQGADWGYAVDPTTLIRCFFGDLVRGKDGVLRAVPDVNGKKLFIDYEAYKIGCEIDDLPKLFAGKDGANDNEKANWGPGHEEIWPGIPNARNVSITADSARPEIIAFMKRQGFRIEGALKGKGSVEEGITWLKNYDIVVHPRCINTIDELSFYSWKTDKRDPSIILPVLEDKKNHIIDPLRYALEGVRRGIAAWERLAG